MRVLLVATLLLLTGCVSEPQPRGFAGDDFNQTDAAKTRISLGLTYLKNGNFSQAKANLDKALEYAPRLANAHYALGYYYQQVGEVARAEEAFDNALSLAPRDADIANSYGAFLCQQGRYKEATEFFLKAVNNQQYANSAETYENMALCAQGQGELEDAIKYFQMALNHQPTRAKSLLLLTQAYVASEQWEEAKAGLRRYERVGRVTPDTLWLAVEIARGQKDFDTAEGYGEMLKSMYPDNPLTKRYEDSQAQQPVIKISQKKKAVATQQETQALAPKPVEVVSTPVIDKVETNDTPANSEPGEVAQVETEAVQPQVEKEAVVKQQQTVDADGTENSNPVKHIVQKQQNLYRISLQYNIKMASLQEWNNLSDAGAIREGMVLWLVPPEQQVE